MSRFSPAPLLWVAALSLASGIDAAAQDLEPRRWTHLPVGTNIVGVGYAYTSGELQFDPVLRIENARVGLHTILASYNRYFSVADMTARVDLQVPYQRGTWDGLLNGVPTTVRRDGFGDPRIRLSMNFYGAPAMDAEEFRDHIRNEDERTIAGVALAVRVPLGEYNDDKLINLGENRFSFQPQIGVVHIFGPWSIEATASLFAYTDNDDFFGGNRLEQAPLYAIQMHVVRTFGQGWWVSAGSAYGRGGRTEINGTADDDVKSNLLYGASAGMSPAAGQSISLMYIRHDALSSTGGDFHNIVLTWAIRF
ncbi:MAG TPA: transporter [Planctomycetota bacterium]|nr:transporter [Planctomycetota bacterium]